MTTSVASPDLKVDRDPLRILTITANLLPIEITDARREHKLRWLVAVLLAVVVLALGFWDFSARQQTSSQQSTLSKTQAQVDSLQKSIAAPQFASINETKSQSAAISDELSKLMAQDVAWYDLVPTLQATAVASGLSLTNVAASLSTASSAAAAPATGTAGTSGVTATDAGSVQLIGSAPDKPQVAAFLVALAKIPGLTNPVLSNLNSQSGSYQFSMSVTFTSSLFAGRFTTKTNGGK
jgi:hypothetical protein